MNGQNKRQPPAFESRLIPLLREGVEMIKMILYKEVRDRLSAMEPQPRAEAGKLAGAVVNSLFGTPNPQAGFAAFVAANQEVIDQELAGLADRFGKLRIPLTDALRMQFLCDSMEGMDSQPALSRAKELGILMGERDLPLPHHFLNLVRRVGRAYGLLLPSAAEKREQ